MRFYIEVSRLIGYDFGPWKLGMPSVRCTPWYAPDDMSDQRLSISPRESDVTESVTDRRSRMCLCGVWIALISLMFVAFSLSSAGPLLRKPLEQCPVGSVAAAALGGVAKGLRACVAAAGFTGANGGPFYACPLHSFKTVLGDAPCSQCARWGRTRCLAATSIQQCVAGVS